MSGKAWASAPRGNVNNGQAATRESRANQLNLEQYIVRRLGIRRVGPAIFDGPVRLQTSCRFEKVPHSVPDLQQHNYHLQLGLQARQLDSQKIEFHSPFSSAAAHHMDYAGLYWRLGNRSEEGHESSYCGRLNKLGK
jgi:hypothetical protein